MEIIVILIYKQNIVKAYNKIIKVRKTQEGGRG